MKTILIIFSLSFFLMLGCSPSDDEFIPTLPVITQTGANTFGCFIDGKLLVPRDGIGSTLGEDVGMSFFGLGAPPNYQYNEIRVRDFKSEIGGLLQFHIVELNQNDEGSFNIMESNCENGIDAYPNINIRCRIWDENTQVFKWYCSIENGGTLSITRYDFENHIVSGTFSCSAQNRDNPDEIIEITDGRFDLKWDTLPDKNFQ